MTPSELAAACIPIYGNRWQSAFARDIARERGTVNRWAKGKSRIPRTVERWLERHQAASQPGDLPGIPHDRSAGFLDR